MTIRNISELNAILERSNASWRAVENHMTRMAPEERQRMLGLKVDRKLLSDLAARPRAFSVILGLPTAVDWRNFNGQNHVSPIKNQAQCGSCVSFCVSAALESTTSISGAGMVDLSEADLHFCSNHGANCGGWWPSDAIDEAKRRGVTTEDLFPYPVDASGNVSAICQTNPNRDSQLYRPGSFSTLQTMGERKQWLATRGPVCAAFHVYDDFFGYNGTSIYRHVTGNHAGYHCVEVVGYSDTDSCWIVKNSWGSNWGDDGYFRISYGECGIDDTSQDRDPNGAVNQFPMYGIDGIQTPSAWRAFELSGAGSADPKTRVAAVSRIPGSMELWWIAPNGSVQAAYWYEGGNWQRYELAPQGSAAPGGGIDAVSRIPGSMEVWWVGSNGSIQAAFWYEGGSWQRYELAPAGSASLGGALSAVSRISNSMELWWIGSNGSIQANYWYEGGNWQRYELAPAGSASLSGSIASVSRIPSSMELWWTGANGSIQANFWYEGSSWQRYELAPAGSASINGSISAVSRIPSSMELWWIGGNGSIQAKFWYEGNNWQGYELAPPGSASLSGGLAAVSRISNSMELWWVGSNGSIQANFWYEGGNWQRYELDPAGSASLSGGIAVTARIPGSMELWWVGANGTIRDNYWYG